MAASVLNKAISGLDPLKKKRPAPVAAKPVARPASVAPPRPVAPVAPAAPATPPPTPRPVQERAIDSLSATARGTATTPPPPRRVSVQAPAVTPRDAVGTTQTSARPVATDPYAAQRTEEARRARIREDQARSGMTTGGGARSGFGLGVPDLTEKKEPDGGGGIRVDGNGNREDLPEEYGETLDETVNREYGDSPFDQEIDGTVAGDNDVLREDLIDQLREDDGGTFEQEIEGKADGVPDGNDVDVRDDVPLTQDDADRLREEALERLQEDEMAALDMELRGENAANLMRTQATTGLGGFGLSGASAALGADVANKGVRNRVLTKADLSRGYRGEGREDRRLDITEKSADAAMKRADDDAAWQDFIRDMSIDELEETDLRDINNDGKIGNMTDEEVAEARGEEGDLERNEAAAEIASRYGGSGTIDDPIGGDAGVDESGLRDLVDAGVGFNDIEVSGSGNSWFVRARGSDGNFYVFAVPPQTGFGGGAAAAESWFREVA